MAVKKKNTAAVVGSMFSVIGGILVFLSFQDLFTGIRVFFEAFNYGADIEGAFSMAMRFTGGQFLVGLIGAILLLIGILTVRSSAAQAARNAAEQGGDAVRRATDEAQQRAQQMQRDQQRKAQEAQQAAQRRVQERARQNQGGSRPSTNRTDGHAQQGNSRLDQLRQRVANDPRMQQVREAANQAGYGQQADRYLPQRAKQGGQGQPQQQRQQPAQQPQRAQAARPQPQRSNNRSRPERLQTRAEQQAAGRLPDAAAQAAERLAARAREAGMETVMPNERPAYAKRTSALTKSSLTTGSLSRTSLSTNSLFKSRYRGGRVSSVSSVEDIVDRHR